MSAPTIKTWQPLHVSSHQSRLLVPTVVSVVSLMIAIGLLLTVRRLSGAFTADLPRPTLLLTALVSVSVAASARRVWRQMFPLDFENVHYFSWSDQFIGWGSSSVPFLMMIGTCFPGERISDWLIWLPLLVLDQFWRQDFFDGGHTDYQVGIVPPFAVSGDENFYRHNSGDSLTLPPEIPDCTQQVFRVREADGREAIYASFQVDFEVGQRYASAYVGFCPPLACQPIIEADPYEGPAAELKVVQAFSHGARIDLKLATTSDSPTQVLVDLAARCPNSPEN